MNRIVFQFIIVAVIFISCNTRQKSKTEIDNKIVTTTSDNTGGDRGIDSVCGYALVNGLKMYYEIHGKGLPLVLIHGGGSTIRTSFGRVLPLFAKRRKVIALELQAHGHTFDRNKDLSFEQDADDVVALLKYLKIENADFFGFSNGGNTTMQIAIRHPALVRKIILASAFFKREGMYPQFWESIKGATLQDMPQALKDAYKKDAPDSNNLSVMFERDKKRMVEFKDWKSEDIKSIQAPAFIIIGDRDVVRPEHAVEMFRLFPHAKLCILPGGHGEYIGEAFAAKAGSPLPDLTVSMIDEFLNEPMPELNQDN